MRLGFRYVKGLRGTEGERIVAARRAGEFLSLADFTRRVRPGRDALQALAEAGAFDGFESSRRTALWEAKALATCREDPLPLERSAPDRHFARLSPAETIRWDYRTTDLSPRGHPLEAVRAGLRAQGLPDAAAVAQLPHGRRVRYAGAVICRQQPGTAKGVVFLTLEDETGFVNVVLWPKVWTTYRVLVKTSPILGVTGRLESQQGVAHLIAEQVWVPQLAAVRCRRAAAGTSSDARPRTLTRPTTVTIVPSHTGGADFDAGVSGSLSESARHPVADAIPSRSGRAVLDSAAPTICDVERGSWRRTPSPRGCTQPG